MINAVGREIPEEILERTGKEVFQGNNYKDGKAFQKASPKVTPVMRNDHDKMVKDIHEALVKCNAHDGMTVSFHHHFREGDLVVCMVMEEIHKMGFKNITLSASSLGKAHDALVPMIEDGTNYGDFLLATIESAKDSFSADELKTLKAGAEQIKEIEGKLTILEQKYPGCGTAPGAGDSVSAEEAGMTASGSDLMKFPSFQGKDLDGNDVDSSKLFAGNSVTVVNFWFTTCNPCVGELADLEALNKDLAAKGGAVVGINSFTLDGDKTAIAEAKDILAKKGVTYSNLWFASDSEAGKFTAGLYSFPTTYVVDKNGNNVKTYSSDAKDITMPMAVLINSDTAGYGELFACDLKDFGKAFLIGEKTAGRADVQETFELSDGGAVVLTTSKMLPYISESFDGKGLTPDTEIILADSLRENLSTLEKDRDTQLQAAISMLAGNSSED